MTVFGLIKTWESHTADKSLVLPFLSFYLQTLQRKQKQILQGKHKKLFNKVNERKKNSVWAAVTVGKENSNERQQ